MIAGLSHNQSKTIAFYDQFTDENPETLPANSDSIEGVIQTVKNVSNGTTEYYHFTTREEALSRIGEAMSNKSLEDFGTALHTFQDTYSHEGLTWYTHIIKGKDPDKTWLAPDKAEAMAKSTFYILRGMNVFMNGLGDKKSEDYIAETDKLWNKSRQQIRSYLELEDKSQTDIAKTAALEKKDEELKSK